MRDIVLFGEDNGHRQIIGALVERLLQDHGVEAQPEWLSAEKGYGRVKKELGKYLRDIRELKVERPDLIIVATDANCKGLNERTNEMQESDPPVEMILAIPDPHVERWLLLDGNAFKTVLGEGCNAPSYKCERNFYKKSLIDSILKTDRIPEFGGIEFAKEIMRKIDISRASRADESFKRFVDELQAVFRRWQP